MSYAPSLESRYCEPITPPAIPRLKMVIPMPEHWGDEMEAHQIDPARVVALYLCYSFPGYDYPCNAALREDFSVVWSRRPKHAFACGQDWKRMLVPIREDVWRCIEQAAAIANCTPHEVFLRVLARQLSFYGASPQRPKSRKATRPAPVVNVILFPAARAPM